MLLMKRLSLKKTRLYFRILLLCISALALVSCLGWMVEAPTFVLRGVTFRPLSFTEMNLLFDLDVQNANRFNLTFESFAYTVYLKNEQIGSGRLEKEILLPSSSTTRMQVPVTAKFNNLSGSLKAVLTEENLPYKMEGKAVVKAAFGSRQFLFSEEGRINLKK